MEHSPVVCLQLINDVSRMLNHHCSLCLFFHDVQSTCQHPRLRPPVSRPSTQLSDGSFYTAPTSGANSCISAGRSSGSVQAIVRSASTSFRQSPGLRRRSSPTDRSLRDLRIDQARRDDLRKKQSEEQLQRVYESQTLAYLNGPYAQHAELERIEE